MTGKCEKIANEGPQIETNRKLEAQRSPKLYFEGGAGRVCGAR